MADLTIFDPALCCSTGVCGPSVDETLVRFAGDVEWLRARGASIQRYNLAQEANAFVGRPMVRSALMAEGPECLPLVVRDGEILSRGRYPSRDEMAAWIGTSAEGGAQVAPSPDAPRRPSGPVSLGGSSGCC
jgi:hypothetical protein